MQTKRGVKGKMRLAMFASKVKLFTFLRAFAVSVMS